MPYFAQQMQMRADELERYSHIATRGIDEANYIKQTKQY